MEKELVVALRKFKLSSKKERRIELDEVDVKSKMAECRLSVLTKAYGKKKANFSCIRNFVTLRWNLNRNTRIVEVGHNVYQIFVSTQREKNKILGERPWIYDNNPLIVLPWKEDLENEKEVFTKTLIWF